MAGRVACWNLEKMGGKSARFGMKHNVCNVVLLPWKWHWITAQKSYFQCAKIARFCFECPNSMWSNLRRDEFVQEIGGRAWMKRWFVRIRANVPTRQNSSHCSCEHESAVRRIAAASTEKWHKGEFVKSCRECYAIMRLNANDNAVVTHSN